MHLVSDATGESVNAVARAVCAQYDSARAVEHMHTLVRTPRRMARVLAQIEQTPGVVLYTVMAQALRTRLEQRCRELDLPCISVLDPVIGVLDRYLGVASTHQPGGQYQINSDDYMNRIAVLDYTVAHDDGRNPATLNEADVVLVGVSRTSKTPTCIYLAYRGIRAANVPIVPGRAPLAHLLTLDRPLVVGLVSHPERLAQLRQNRLLSMQARRLSAYADRGTIDEETRVARQLFARRGWPVIDVTRRAVEETAATILNLHARRLETRDPP